jgi:hypothetical protein
MRHCDTMDDFYELCKDFKVKPQTFKFRNTIPLMSVNNFKSLEMSGFAHHLNNFCMSPDGLMGGLDSKACWRLRGALHFMDEEHAVAFLDKWNEHLAYMKAQLTPVTMVHNNHYEDEYLEVDA